MTRFMRLYNERWSCTRRGLFYKNLISADLVFLVCCYAIRTDMLTTYDATKAGLFSLLLAMTWSGLFNSIGLYSEESIYTNDDMSKSLPLHVYIEGTVWIQLKLCFLQTLECICIYYYFFGFNQQSVVFPLIIFDFGLTFFLILFSADMLGLALGTCVNSVSSALSIIPVALVFQLLLSGCLFDLDGIMKYVSVFTTARYGFSALGSIVDLNGEELPLQISAYYPEVIKQSNDLFECSAAYITDCWKNLFLISVICLLLAGLSLYIKINRKH